MRKKKRGIIAPSFSPSPPPLFPDTKSEKGPTFSIQNSRILCFECSSIMGRAGLNKRKSKTAQNVSWALELCVYVTLGKWKAYKVTQWPSCASKQALLHRTRKFLNSCKCTTPRHRKFPRKLRAVNPPGLQQAAAEEGSGIRKVKVGGTFYAHHAQCCLAKKGLTRNSSQGQKRPNLLPDKEKYFVPTVHSFALPLLLSHFNYFRFSSSGKGGKNGVWNGKKRDIGGMKEKDMTIIVLLWVGLPPSHAKINLMSRPSSSPFSIRRQSGEVERRKAVFQPPFSFRRKRKRRGRKKAPLLSSHLPPLATTWAWRILPIFKP